MNFTVIIPARYQSVRLPGKPLLDIAGKPMIQHVYEQVQKSRASNIIIATDHPDIEKVAKGFGADVFLTNQAHQSGTDRITEVVEALDLADDGVVVNVQGDEPLIPPQVVDQVAENLINHSDYDMATLMLPIRDVDTLNNPNCVKVVSSHTGKALYFTRAPVPLNRDQENFQPLGFRHVGIYAYQVQCLQQFVSWPQGVLEKIEKLEQLRVLEYDGQIHVDIACCDIPHGIDDELDLSRIRALVEQA